MGGFEGGKPLIDRGGTPTVDLYCRDSEIPNCPAKPYGVQRRLEG